MKILKLPKLTNEGQGFCQYNLNNKNYHFEFQWCDNFCLINIYFINENTKNTILKNYPLVRGVDLINRIKNSELISGKLYFQNIYEEDIEPEITNFSEDFELIYYEENEAENSEGL